VLALARSVSSQRGRFNNFVGTIVNIAVIVAISFSPNVGWAAHLFGFMGGALLFPWVHITREYARQAAANTAAARGGAGGHLLGDGGGRGPPPLPLHNRVRAAFAAAGVATAHGAGAPAVSKFVSGERRYVVLRWAGLASYLLLLLAGLLGLFLGTTPPRGLLV